MAILASIRINIVIIAIGIVSTSTVRNTTETAVMQNRTVIAQNGTTNKQTTTQPIESTNKLTLSDVTSPLVQPHPPIVQTHPQIVQTHPQTLQPSATIRKLNNSTTLVDEATETIDAQTEPWSVTSSLEPWSATSSLAHPTSEELFTTHKQKTMQGSTTAPPPPIRTTPSGGNDSSGTNTDNTQIYTIASIIIVIFIIIMIVALVVILKFESEARALWRRLRACLARISSCYKKTYAEDNAECGNVTTMDVLPSVRSTQSNNKIDNGLIPTESMLDLSKLATTDNEETDEDFEKDDLELIHKTEDDTKLSQPISVQDFITRFGPNDVEKDQLKLEFDLIGKKSKEIRYTRLHAKIEQNRKKNRYYDIIPYDYNRVPLYDTPNLKGPDHYRTLSPKARRKIRFINASYVHEFNSKQMKYIAAQGPLGITIHDFWEMVWQEECDVIVMLTSLRELGKVKCEQYWPSKKDDVLNCRDIMVKLEVTQVYAYYDYRSIIVYRDGTSRRVHHYQYHHWPDKEAPEVVLPILDLHRKVFSHERKTKGPIVIHCSAGVGRTGTFIALDYLQEQARQTEAVDVLGCVYELRRQRLSMVQKVSQYIFIHEAIHEALEVGITTIPTANFKEWFSKNANDEDYLLTKQFEKMCEKKRMRKADQELCGLLPDNIAKNRDIDIIPDDDRRPYLFTFMKGRNAYINAVYVDTFLAADGVIVTQTPTADTICDFWRLVYDRSCTTIVLLHDMKADSEDCPTFWPADGEQTSYGEMITVVGQKNVKLSTACITVRDYQVIMTQQADYVVDVKFLQLETWPLGHSFPPNKLDFMELIRMTNVCKKNAIIVQCYDGCDRSGLFCACLFIMDQIQMDRDIDVYNATRIITANRPQFISNKEQYKFLHEFALEYMQLFDEYSNFADVVSVMSPASVQSVHLARPCSERKSARRSESLRAMAFVRILPDTSDSDSEPSRRIQIIRSDSDESDPKSSRPRSNFEPSSRVLDSDENKDIYVNIGKKKRQSLRKVLQRVRSHSNDGDAETTSKKETFDKVVYRRPAGQRSSMILSSETMPQICRSKSTFH